MSADTASPNLLDTIISRWHSVREQALWRLIRRYLGPHCPKDACDAVTVMKQRKVCAHFLSRFPMARNTDEVILLAEDSGFGCGRRLDECNIIDREPVL